MEIISVENARIAIEKPGHKNNGIAVLFIPGSSGQVFTDKFNSLKKALLDDGYNYVPVEIWKNEKEIEMLTLEKIFYAIDNVIDELKKQGFEHFYAVGKSLGGGMLLARNNPEIEKMVLWAPAIGIGEKTTISNLYNLTLNKVKSIFDFENLI